MVIWCRLLMDFLFINGVIICRFFKFFDVVFLCMVPLPPTIVTCSGYTFQLCAHKNSIDGKYLVFFLFEWLG